MIIVSVEKPYPLSSEEQADMKSRLESDLELMKKGAEWWTKSAGEGLQLVVPRDVQLEIIREHEGLETIDRLHARKNVVVPWRRQEEFGGTKKIETPYFTVLKEVDEVIDRFWLALQISNIRRNREEAAKGHYHGLPTNIRDYHLKELKDFETWGIVSSEQKTLMEQEALSEAFFNEDGSPKYTSEEYYDFDRRMDNLRRKERAVRAIDYANEQGLLRGKDLRDTEKKLVTMVLNDELSPGAKAFITEVELFKLIDVYMGDDRKKEVLEQMKKGEPMDTQVISLGISHLNYLSREWMHPSKRKED